MLTGIRLVNGGEPGDGESEECPEEDPFPTRVTRGDEKMDFSEKSPMKEIHGKVSENAKSTSPHAQSSSPDSSIEAESPPETLPYNCGHCGQEVTLALGNGNLYAYRCTCGNRGKVAQEDYEKLRTVVRLQA